jgi:hypothetical protein
VSSNLSEREGETQASLIMPYPTPPRCGDIAKNRPKLPSISAGNRTIQAIFFGGVGIEVSELVWILNWRRNHVLSKIDFACRGACAGPNGHSSSIRDRLDQRIPHGQKEQKSKEPGGFRTD